MQSRFDAKFFDNQHHTMYSMLAIKTIPRGIHIQARFKSTVLLKFFTKKRCMLCTNANEVLKQAISSPEVDEVDLEFTKIDIMDPKNERWFEKYCYDVPVLHIEKDQTVKKHMHYFDKSDLISDIREISAKAESNQ